MRSQFLHNIMREWTNSAVKIRQQEFQEEQTVFAAIRGSVCCIGVIGGMDRYSRRSRSAVFPAVQRANSWAAMTMGAHDDKSSAALS